VVLIYLAQSSEAKYRPAVLMHGITATNESVIHIKDILESELPGIYVRAMEIGDHPSYDSIFTGMDTQVQMFCDQVSADPQLQDGFNLMGFSQGGVIVRGYLERCNNPPVFNFISWVSPQGGQFGCPGIVNWTFVDELADCCIYDEWVQESISFAGYWRDPFDVQGYIDYVSLLPDINNERAKNAQYKANVLSVQNFVMAYSLVDTVLDPPETGWFGVFANNTWDTVIPLESQDIWIEDFIGLRTLNSQGKLHRFTTTCDHGDYSSSCFDKYFMPNVFQYFNNTL